MSTAVPFAAYVGEGPFVFVSYAHADRGVVYAEMKWLRTQGFDIWYDEGISPGAKWNDELADAIQRCTVFVVFMTPNAAASEHVENEIHHALKHRKPVVLIRLVPTTLAKGLDFQLAKYQWIDVDADDTAVYHQKLAKTLLQHYPPSIIRCPRCKRQFRVIASRLSGGIAHCEECNTDFSMDDVVADTLNDELAYLAISAPPDPVLLEKGLTTEHNFCRLVVGARRIVLFLMIALVSRCIGFGGMWSFGYALPGYLYDYLAFVLSAVLPGALLLYMLLRYLSRYLRSYLVTSADWLVDNGYHVLALERRAIAR